MFKREIVSKRPPMERALLQLNLDTLDWLTAAGVRSQSIDRISRATMRASHAIELAHGGSRMEANLRRARDAMITYLNLMRFLCLHDQLVYEQFDEAERRVEQIRDGLKELERRTLAQWPEMDLPPLRPPCADAVSPSGESTVPPSDRSPPGDRRSPPAQAESSRPDLDGTPIDDDPDGLEKPDPEDELTSAKVADS